MQSTETAAELRTETLKTYLNDHAAGAEGGVRLAEELAEQNPSLEGLAGVAAEISEDHDALKRLMEKFGTSGSAIKEAGVLSAGKFATAILSDTTEKGQALTTLRELELLAMGVRGKLCLWLALEEIQGTDERLSGTDLAKMTARARSQLDVLEGCIRTFSRKALLS